MVKVYVAGAISAPCPQDLKNIGIGQRATIKLIEKGYLPFSPFLDNQLFLHKEGMNITKQMIQDYSIGWLLNCEIVYVLPGHENSAGTQREIDAAMEHNIPVVYNEDDLVAEARRIKGLVAA